MQATIEQVHFLATSEEIRDFEPCPFCGGGYQEIFETDAAIDVNGRRHSFAARCECGASLEGSCHVFPYENADERVVFAARRAWNERA